MTLVILFVLGLIVGSFLNVLGLRFNSGLTLGGRSFCVSCRKKLLWWELVPVISFVGLRGKCSACSTKISKQYPFIELLTGFVFVSIHLVLSPLTLFSYLESFLLIAAVFSIYIVILIYDYRHKIIPDQLVYASLVLALLYRYFMVPSGLSDWLAGPILFSGFGLLWLISRGRAMGFGDAKLALSIGFLLGAAESFSAIALAFWIGLASVIIFLIFGKSLTMKSEIPFAPFMIIGAWVAFAFHLDLFHVQYFLQ